jgi:hypothetical protein
MRKVVSDEKLKGASEILLGVGIRFPSKFQVPNFYALSLSHQSLDACMERLM